MKFGDFKAWVQFLALPFIPFAAVGLWAYDGIRRGLR